MRPIYYQIGSSEEVRPPELKNNNIYIPRHSARTPNFAVDRHYRKKLSDTKWPVVRHIISIYHVTQIPIAFWVRDSTAFRHMLDLPPSM